MYQLSPVKHQTPLPVGTNSRESSALLDGEAQQLERIWLGLRRSAGLDLSDATVAQQRSLQLWQNEGWANVREGCVTLSPSGWLLLDQLAVELSVGSRVEPSQFSHQPARTQ